MRVSIEKPKSHPRQEPSRRSSLAHPVETQRTSPDDTIDSQTHVEPVSVQAKLKQAFDPPAQRSAPPQPVQLSRSHDQPTPEQIHEAAKLGISGPGGPLPYLDQIQRAFGHHDLSTVVAHTDEQAAQGARAMGAEAFTTGNHIAFAGTPTLHTAAHEAAHVIQQRAGVQLSHGIGTAGDSYEQHADVVAERVARRPVSEEGLDKFESVRSEVAGDVMGLPVQLSSSGEHASMGSGEDYPFVMGPTLIVNGIPVTRGELVAFGDFYAGPKQLSEAPPIEIKALAGFVRLDGLWLLASRVPTSRWDQHYKTFGTFKHKEEALHREFGPAWTYYGIQIEIGKRPDDNLVPLKATLGRRAERDENDPNESHDSDKDPQNVGGDYIDISSSNIAHFSRFNWNTYSKMHESACRSISDKSTSKANRQFLLNQALSSDALACHYLTDMFASGHQLVDKQMLMTYANEIFSRSAQKKAGPDVIMKGNEKHESFGNLLEDTLKECFQDKAVQDAWVRGLRNAWHQQLLRPRVDRDLPELIPPGYDPSSMDILPFAISYGNHLSWHTTVVDQLAWHVIMPMPWRKEVGLGATVDEQARSWGATSQPPGEVGAYHLGIGNLAAVMVHDAFNQIGVEVKNEAGDTWKMFGDGRLDQKSLQIANQLVEQSSQAVREAANNHSTGRNSFDFGLSAIKKHTPSMVRFNPEAIIDHFADSKNGFDPNSMTLKKLYHFLKNRAGDFVPITENEDKSMGWEVRRVCEMIIETIFTPNTEGGSLGINTKMLKSFLSRNLDTMLPLAYVAADFGDLPKEAQKLYKKDKGARDRSRLIAEDRSLVQTVSLINDLVSSESYALVTKIFEQQTDPSEIFYSMKVTDVANILKMFDNVNAKSFGEKFVDDLFLPYFRSLAKSAKEKLRYSLTKRGLFTCWGDTYYHAIRQMERTEIEVRNS